MKRRDFLSIAAGSYGSCLIPPAIARQIRDVCIGASNPLVLAPQQHALELFAQENYGSYLLHLGDPNGEPEYPTLREFMECRSFDPSDDESLREYLIEWRCFDEEGGEDLREAIANLEEEMDDPIDEGERASWNEWEGETSVGTLPEAYHYLRDLPLNDGRTGGESVLGELSFIEGDRPGSNLTYVEADGLAAIASLQHRLNELKTGTRIVIA